MAIGRRNGATAGTTQFIGARPTLMLINVFYNGGEAGDGNNDGKWGTPVLIDLGFDAGAAFHRYAIEWDPTGMRWFVDGELVSARMASPTPVPHLPLRLHLNVWPIDAEELAGDDRSRTAAGDDRGALDLGVVVASAA